VGENGGACSCREAGAHDTRALQVLTFDAYGVSGHLNHRAVHRGVQQLLQQQGRQLGVQAGWQLVGGCGHRPGRLPGAAACHAIQRSGGRGAHAHTYV
jgi:LmbE family N-acetylglucosaminyl deacetylase